MRKIGKLVRDKIPATIEANGEAPITRRLSDSEFLAELDRKLLEEANEFLENHDLDELADILEVIQAYCDLLNIRFDKLEAKRAIKARKNGGFEKRVYLESVE